MAEKNLVVRLQGDDKLSGVISNVKKQLDETTASGDKLENIKAKFDKISNSTAPLRRKVKDCQKAMEELQTSGLAATEQGKKMFDELAAKARQYNTTLKQISDSTRAVGDSSSNIGGGGLDVKSIMGNVADKAGLGGLTSQFGSLTAMVNPTTAAIAATAGVMVMAGKAAGEFETHLDSLQSLTGLTDAEMKKISKSAVDMSKDFRASASDIVDAMKLIGSQAPELLKDSDALTEVTRCANVLAEAAQIEVVDSAKAITGVMNQMGASSSEAADIINTFAAASQQGAADVEYLNKAFEKSGTAAKGAGMDYTQLAAVVETVAPKFSSADVAGSQLASTLLKLSMSGKSDFMPSVVGMQTALDNLAKAEMDDVAIKNLVGESNVTMLKSLIEGRNQFKAYNESLRGTNTAFEQMATNNDNFAGAINKIKSKWDAFLITLGQSSLMQGICDNIMNIMDALGEVVDVISDVISAFDAFGDGTAENCNIAKLQLDILVGVIKGVGEVLEVIIRIAAKVFDYLKEQAGKAADWIGEKWQALKNTLGDVAFVRVVIAAFQKVLDAAAKMCDTIKKYWNKLKEFLGMKVDTNVGTTTEKLDSNVPTADTNTNGTNTTTTTTTGKGKGKGSGKKTEKIDYLVSVDDNTLDTAEKKLQAWTSKKKTINIDDTEALAKCQEEIDKWSKEVYRRKTIINAQIVANDNGTLDYAQKILKNLQEQRLSIPVGENISEDVQKQLDETNAEIDKWEKEIERRKIALGLLPKIEEGSLNYIDEQIKKKQDEIKLALNTDISPEDLKKLQDELDALRKSEQQKKIELGIAPAANSLNGIKAQIADIEQQINLALNTDIDPDSLKALQTQLEALRKQEREKSIELGVIVPPTIQAPNADNTPFTQGSAQDKRQSYDNAQSTVNEIKTNYRIGVIGKEEAEEQIAQLNEKLAELGMNELQLTVHDDGTIKTAMEELDAYVERMNATSDIIGNMGSAFGSLGDAIGGTAGNILDFAGQTMNAVSQIIPQVVKLIAAKQAESMASGTASAAEMPFPANIAAMASIIATVVSLFASIPKSFADGGVISGSAFHGDSMLAHVNSGEMILNKNQQSNLYRTLKNGNVGNNGGGQVEFKISGSNLKGVLSNFDKKMNPLK